MRAIRWMALADSTALGFAEAYRPAGAYSDVNWMIHVGVLPEHRGRGVGAALFDAVWSHVDAAGQEVVSSRVREDDPAALAFAQKRGFREANRDFESQLDLQGVDLNWLRSLLHRLDGEVELVSFAELDSPEFRSAFHELFEEVRKDIPRLEPPVRLEFDFFQRMVLDDPLFLREGSFVAMVEGRPIGLSGGYRGTNEGWMDQWLTAVRREYRGRGIAQALKAKTALWGRANGFSTIRTDNNSMNRAMLAINDRFGFKRSAAVLTVRRS